MMEQGATLDVFESPSHPYTKGLLRAVPRIDRDDTDLLTIAGEPPDMSRLSAGCPFSPRCEIVRDACSTQKPPLTLFDSKRMRACHADLAEVRDV